MMQALLVLILAVLFASVVIAIVTAVALAFAAIAALIVLRYVVTRLYHAGQSAHQRHHAKSAARAAGDLQVRLRALQQVAALEHELDLAPHLDPKVLGVCSLCGDAGLRTAAQMVRSRGVPAG